MTRLPVEAAVPQGSPPSPILCAIWTSELIQWVEEYISAAELSFVDNLGWVVTRPYLDQVLIKLGKCRAKFIDWENPRGLQSDTAKTEVAVFTSRWGHKKCIWPNLTGMVTVRASSTRFNKEATRWLGVLMDVYLTFKEHHNQCMNIIRAAEARLGTLTKANGVIPEMVRAVQISCFQAVAFHGSKLRCDTEDSGKRDNLQLLPHWQARSNLGARCSWHHEGHWWERQGLHWCLES